jgi:predicted dithiol-disulfide oxidoreductase (DUF899 family)
MHDKRFPGESDDYRVAREALLAKEQELRALQEEVAQLRRNLPPGGALRDDYLFQEVSLVDGATTDIRFSDLFGDKSDLLVYSYMYGPDWADPCPSCTSAIDGFNAMSRHVRQQVEMVVVGKASPAQLAAVAEERGWTDIRLLSSQNNEYTRDYLSQPDASTESLIPIMNSFHKDGKAISHVWASELFWTQMPGGHPRHIDTAWPLWAMLDMTRAGRHPDMGPKLRY